MQWRRAIGGKEREETRGGGVDADAVDGEEEDGRGDGRGGTAGGAEHTNGMGRQQGERGGIREGGGGRQDSSKLTGFPGCRTDGKGWISGSCLAVVHSWHVVGGSAKDLGDDVRGNAIELKSSCVCAAALRDFVTLR